jgi:type I restriction enzyme M protein
MPRTPDTKFFLKKLQELNGSAGNMALREKLQWTEEKYFMVRKTIIEEGLVDIGRGKGGSVYMLGEPATTGNASADKQKTQRVESYHYTTVM